MNSQINWKSAVLFACFGFGCYKFGVAKTESKFRDELRKIRQRAQELQ